MTTETTSDDVLARLVQWHEAADQSTVDARSDAERDRDYTDGKQWTDEEVAKLQKRKQPVVTINRIKPKVDFLKGQEQQRRMMPRAFPRTPAEEQGAAAATDALRFVMDQSKWDRERSGCFDNHLVEGACGVDVQVYQKPDGDYCVEAKQIAWDRMWGDPHSRARDWSDAKYKGQFIWMDFEEAAEKWPDKVDVLESTIGSESLIADTFNDVPRTRWADPKRKRVRIAECWSREGGKVFHSKFTKAGILSRIESPFVDEDGNQDDGFVFGSCNIDRDGNRYGVVRQWISIQDEINKRRSKMLHLLSVRQTFGNQTVGDKNKLRQELAKPDGHVELAGGAKMGEDFGILPTGDLSQGQRELLVEAKSEIDAVGVNAALSGNEGRVMSGRALMARSEQGLSELGPVFDAFTQFQYDVYRKVWNRIRQFWTAEKWIRVTDDDRNVRFVGLNQPLTLGEQLLEEARQQGTPITPEMEQQAKMDPRMQTIVGVKNKIAELDVDIVIDDVPASATLQTEAFEQLVQIAPQAATMPPPMFEALIEASPLRNKDKILKKLRGEEEGKLPAQAQQQMEQMQQAIEQAQQIIGDLQGKLAAAQTQAQAAKASEPAIDLARREMALKHEQELFEANQRYALLELKLAGMGAQMQGLKAQQAEADALDAAGEMQQAGQEMAQVAAVLHEEHTQPTAVVVMQTP
jgi:tetratricopeptide (TPR) repeat protein